MAGLSPKLPLHVDQNYGYGLTKTFKEVAQQNLKMLIMTSPGERIMLPNFGVGIRRFLFENITQRTFDEIEEKIYQQTKIYLPYITIESINFYSDRATLKKVDFEPSMRSNYLQLELNYSIPQMFISNTLILEI
jgi:phage baseplate assembly protein W|tara:strand:- start:8368 stop:8769 length:402 start_codon:yes stop_codon:yes gene_type:complete